MPHITRELIRKRAEHNESIIATLEEIALHQEELEGISDVLGTSCRKLKILMLQNNIIPRMENLHHLKELEYLNLALNNIDMIQGLDRCEFLNKLDMTVNFVDFDALEQSVTNLQKCRHLGDLFMMGNPCQMDWEEGFEHYVIHRLPQLKCLDGKDITKSMRIVAAQHFPRLEAELRVKSTACVARKEVDAVATAEAAAAKAARRAEIAEAAAKLKVDKETAAAEKAARREAALAAGVVIVEDDDDSSDDDDDDAAAKDPEEDDETCAHTPENRVEMYREIAEEKAEKEAREQERLPKKRDYTAEQQEAIERTRQLELEGKIRQCNEGKWEFSFDESKKSGNVVLDIGVPKHLDSSLIDVDVHPNYVSVVIKSKILRLTLPAEVDSSNSSAQRSKTTGHLVLTMPKVNPNENALGLRVSAAQKKRETEAKLRALEAKQASRDSQHLAYQLQAEARKAKAGRGAGGKASVSTVVPTGGAVKIQGLVGARHGGVRQEPLPTAQMNAVSTTILAPPKPPPVASSKAPTHAFSDSVDDDDEGYEDSLDDSEPPPPM